jgi:hypothetical protein
MGLDAEMRRKGIHVQAQTPLFVTTKLAKIRNPSLTTPTPTGYVKAAIKFVGYESLCSPYWYTSVCVCVSVCKVRVYVLCVVCEWLRQSDHLCVGVCMWVFMFELFIHTTHTHTHTHTHQGARRAAVCFDASAELCGEQLRAGFAPGSAQARTQEAAEDQVMHMFAIHTSNGPSCSSHK